MFLMFLLYRLLYSVLFLVFAMNVCFAGVDLIDVCLCAVVLGTPLMYLFFVLFWAFRRCI